MPRDGTVTRNKIMDVAQQMVLNVGLSGASVEKVIEQARVTKRTFFYHLKTKHDLAAALIERYADQDEHHFVDYMSKTEHLSHDPLQQLLLFFGLFIDMTEQLEEPFSGCLYAPYCFQSGAISTQSIAQVERMMHYQVADHVLTSFEGAFILCKVMNEPRLASQQLVQCRNYIELLFSPDPVAVNEPGS